MSAWPGWPAPMGAEQYDYEPPRVLPEHEAPADWADQLEGLGNAVVPSQAAAAFCVLLERSGWTL